MSPGKNTAPARPRFRDAAALAAFVVLCLAVAAAGGAITATSVSTWYAAWVAFAAVLNAALWQLN